MEPDARQPDLEPDERIASLVNEYFDRRQAGEELTPEQFAVEHPELAGELQPYLEGLSLLDQIRSSTPDVQAAMEAAPWPGRLPEIEGYDLIGELGRGGMGVVYKALQVSTKRIVALKVLLTGPFASPAAQRRFEREVELTARLRHPNIASVLESGHVSTGHQYFAMDFVDGVHLDAYVSRVQPDVRATLALFETICDALEYAQGHGVVHRDLKPANVVIDEQGQPHILDFGLAKALDHSDTADSLGGPASAPGQVMGTLKYLSPEQAAGTPEQVDVRTDVYAIGVMLYEALTGSLPYDTTGPAPEVIRRILENPPKAPSLVSRRIDGELETILLRTLEKESDRRYRSVGELGEDLRHYLAGEPIIPMRSNHWYVFRKRLLKYRSRVALVAAALALGMFGVWGGIQWSQRTMQQQRVRELLAARRHIMRIQRGLEARDLGAVKADAYTATARYPQVIEARLVAAQARFEAVRIRPDEDQVLGDQWGIVRSPIGLLEYELQGDPTLWPCRLLLGELYYYRYREQTALADQAEEELARLSAGAADPEASARGSDTDEPGEEPDESAPSAEKLKAEIVELRRKADESKKAAEENEALANQEAPDSAEAWYLKSFTKLSLQEPLECAQRALARDPNHELAWERLTYLADELEDYEAALTGVKRLMELDPENTEWAVVRTRIVNNMRERELAEERSDRRESPESGAQDGSEETPPDMPGGTASPSDAAPVGNSSAGPPDGSPPRSYDDHE